MSDVPKTKPEDTLEAEEDYIDAMLELVADCQTEVDELNMKATEEILQIEATYNKLRKPHFEKRGELIKKIAQFWMIAFMHHSKVALAVDPEDEDCLRSLYHVVVQEADDIKSGYRITLYFEENAYFENKTLTKEYFFRTLSKSTTIDWKEGKNLQKYTPRKRHTKNRYFDYRTFFDWFSHDVDIIQDEIGMTIRDEIWPNPLQYYQLKGLLEQAAEEDAKDDGK